MQDSPSRHVHKSPPVVPDYLKGPKPGNILFWLSVTGNVAMHEVMSAPLNLCVEASKHWDALGYCGYGARYTGRILNFRNLQRLDILQLTLKENPLRHRLAICRWFADGTVTLTPRFTLIRRFRNLRSHWVQGTAISVGY